MSLAGSLILDQMCSATIGVCPSTCGSWVNDFVLKVSTAVWSSVAVAVAFSPLVFRAGFLWIKLKVYATSVAVNGWPSVHFTPARVVMRSEEHTSKLQSLRHL